MAQDDIKQLLYAWAEWTVKGKTLMPSTSSIMALIMAGGVRGRGPQDDVEQTLDDIIQPLASSNNNKHRQWAELIVLHFNVAKNVRHLSNKQKAYRLDITEPTYYRRLSAALEYISQEYFNR